MLTRVKMITFKLSFLLSFALEINKKKSTTKSQKANRSVNETQSLSDLLGSVHINYELVPGKCKYDLDVLCWGAVSKIITKDTQIIMKTIIRDGKVWLPFCVDHNIGNLKLEEVRKYRDYIIQFNITANNIAGRNIIMQCYNMEANDLFYEIVEDVTRKSIPEFRSDNLENYLRILIMRSLNQTNEELVSWLHGPDNYQRFYEIINKECNGEVYRCREFNRTTLSTRESNVQKASIAKRNSSKTQTKRVQKNVKRVEPTNINILVPAEVFFTDPKFSIFKGESATGLVRNAFVTFTVESLMTRAQKLILNSMVLKIKKLDNIPVDILKQLGIESLFLTYDIPAVATCKSVIKPLAEKIRFEENHIYFTDQVPKLKFIEYLQSQRFYVEIYGNRTEMLEEQQCRLFGEEPGDYEISHRNITEEPLTQLPNPILLAVAAYDVSSLLDNTWDFREIGQCHAPNLTFFQKPYTNYDIVCFSDNITANEVNFLPLYRSTYPVVLQEATLLSLGTCLEIESFIMAPQAASLIFHQTSNTFKRLFVIFYNEELATTFYNEINEYNTTLLDELKKNANQKNPETEDIVTGFLLDNGNNYAFFVEGFSHGFILNAWHIVDHCTPQEAKVFFNTDHIFERRLYTHFLGEGLFTITLKIPLYNILAKYELYLRKNVPESCMEALKKFSLLFHASNMRSILQQNMLPAPRDLLSLDLEWGVPLRWKKTPIEKVESTLF